MLSQIWFSLHAKCFFAGDLSYDTGPKLDTDDMILKAFPPQSPSILGIYCGYRSVLSGA